MKWFCLLQINQHKTDKKLDKLLTHTAVYSSPIGFLLLKEENETLVSATFSDNAESIYSSESTVLKNTIQQLDEYFNGHRKIFDLPINAAGTSFQKTVWDELQKIPFNNTITYLQLAKRLGNVKSIRAAASANGKNPLAIIIPCHRVIGADGKLTGYAGGLHRKKWLLEHEANSSGNKSLLF